MFNKRTLVTQIISSLTELLAIAKEGAENAHAGAINEQSVAETQYDTLGLESAYLAEGLGRRVVMYQQEILAYQQLVLREFDHDTPIRIGAYIVISNDEGNERHLFFGPCSGGLTIVHNHNKLSVITAESPLGRALLDKQSDDEATLTVAGQPQRWYIDTVC